MGVKRIVTNINATQPASAKVFYHDLLGLELLMDHGWIQIYGQDTTMSVQVSFASEGGSGMPSPQISPQRQRPPSSCTACKEYRTAYGIQSRAR